jgi:hypothetical protein
VRHGDLAAVAGHPDPADEALLPGFELKGVEPQALIDAVRLVIPGQAIARPAYP